mgnify:CR=1 FL=1
MNAHPRLLVDERRQKILDLVEKQGRVTVNEMVKRFGVSAVTVRGDLRQPLPLGGRHPLARRRR